MQDLPPELREHIQSFCLNTHQCRGVNKTWQSHYTQVRRRYIDSRTGPHLAKIAPALGITADAVLTIWPGVVLELYELCTKGVPRTAEPTRCPRGGGEPGYRYWQQMIPVLHCLRSLLSIALRGTHQVAFGSTDRSLDVTENGLEVAEIIVSAKKSPPHFTVQLYDIVRLHTIIEGIVREYGNIIGYKTVVKRLCDM